MQVRFIGSFHFASWDFLARFMFCDIAIGAEDLGSIPGPVKSDTVSSTARQRCDASVLPRR